jgi:hypothetical protein
MELVFLSQTFRCPAGVATFFRERGKETRKSYLYQRSVSMRKGKFMFEIVQGIARAKREKKMMFE